MQNVYNEWVINCLSWVKEKFFLYLYIACSLRSRRYRARKPKAGVLHNQCSRPGIQTKIEIVYLGGAITADRDLSIEITRRLQRAWACFQRCKMEIYDRPGVRVRLIVRLLKAEVVETLLYGCMT